MELYKTIDNFNLDVALTEMDVIEFTDQFGDVMRYKERTITEGVTLLVYDSGQAALELPNQLTVDFVWTEEVSDTFYRFDEVKALELFDTLLRNSIEA